MTMLSRFIFCMLIACSVQALAEEKSNDSSQAKPNQKSPNVILIYIDDLGFGDLGCFGCKDTPTPHIDRLATEGVRCTASLHYQSSLLPKSLQHDHGPVWATVW